MAFTLVNFPRRRRPALNMRRKGAQVQESLSTVSLVASRRPEHRHGLWASARAHAAGAPPRPPAAKGSGQGFESQWAATEHTCAKERYRVVAHLTKCSVARCLGRARLGRSDSAVFPAAAAAVLSPSPSQAGPGALSNACTAVNSSRRP